jgi:spore germination protein KB
MIKISDGKIGVREFCALVLLTLSVKGADTTPDLLTTAGLNAAWLLSVISYVVIAIPLFVLLPLIKKHNVGLIELIFILTGKKFGFMIGMLLSLMLLYATVINSRAHIDIVTTLFFPQTSLPALYALFFIIIYSIAKRSIEAITRASWLLLWWMSFIIFLLLFLVSTEMNWLHLFPLLGPGLRSLTIEGVRHSGLFADAILLTALYSYTRSYKEFRISILVGFAGSFIWIVSLMAAYQMTYDFPAVNSINYMFQQMTRITAIAGTITHLEALFLAFWVMTSVIHFAVYIYTAVFFLARTTKIRHFEPLLLSIAGLITLGGLIPHHVVDLNHARESASGYYSFVFISLPLLLWVLDRMKGRMSQ